MCESRRRYLRCLAVGIAVLALVPARANAQQCKNDGGTFQANLLLPSTCDSIVGICTLGTLDGKSQETYRFVMDTLRPALDPTEPNKFIYTGHSVITRVRGGATMTGQDSGVLVFDEMGGGSFVTTVQVAGGTKQYSDASGQFIATGHIDFISGQVAGTFTSTVCK